MQGLTAESNLRGCFKSQKSVGASLKAPAEEARNLHTRSPQDRPTSGNVHNPDLLDTLLEGTLIFEPMHQVWPHALVPDEKHFSMVRLAYQQSEFVKITFPDHDYEDIKSQYSSRQ